MSDQLELFDNEPFSLRLKFDEATKIFRDNYWKYLASDKTSSAHFRRLNMFFKHYYLDTISKADVERMRRWMHEMGYSEPTINKAHMILSRIYHKFEEYKEGKFVSGTDFSKLVLPKKNPAALVKKTNERKFARRVFITPQQKKILCSYSDEDLAEIIDGLYWTELRISDFFRITHLNVDLQKRVIFGTQHKTITTSNPSGVPYKVHIPKAKLAMIERRVKNTKPGTPIFRKKNLGKRFLRVKIMSGMPEAQLRDLRGSAASYLLDHGVDPQTVSKTLGHTSLRMLPTYDKRPEENMAKATEILVDKS